MINATVKPKEKSQVELTVEVPAKEFGMYIERAAKKLSSDNPIKGFRPGKASVQVVAETFGQDRLLHDAMDLALPRFFVEAALDHDIEAINRPAITVHQLGLDEPFKFMAVVDVLPEVTLGDVKKISAKQREVEVDDTQVEKELTYLARMRSKYIDSIRPSQEGDVVTVDFTVKMNGEVMEGGTSKNHPITIGDGQFVPDFEKGLLGLSASETRTYLISFPDDFPKEDLRGKKAEVEVTAHAVQQRIIPVIDDEFAKNLGKFKNLQNLKDELKKNIGKELEQKEKDRFLGELAEKLADSSTFAHVPDVLVEKEIEQRLQELAQMLSLQKKTMDQYLADNKKTLDQVKAEMREEALKHVKVGLAMRAFAKMHNITATDEEIGAKVNEHLKAYEHIPQAHTQIDPEDLKERVASSLRNQKTLEKLAEIVEKK